MIDVEETREVVLARDSLLREFERMVGQVNAPHLLARLERLIQAMIDARTPPPC